MLPKLSVAFPMHVAAFRFLFGGHGPNVMNCSISLLLQQL